MRYLSVCSGIEAATVAWHPLGWEAAAYSEIEAFPSAVLEHHYPDVPNLGDMELHRDWRLSDVDLLVGGTPCQSFSVAGLRAGMADPRGNLALVYLAIAERLRPRWLVWENVPGVLSSDGGRDFGAILGGMVELGYGVAYRVLDAQHFGVPQRRRRVFVVGHLGSWQRAAAVLFERESLRRNPAPSREAGQDVTQTLRGGSAGGSSHGKMSGSDQMPMVARPLKAGGNLRHREDSETYVAHSLSAEGCDASEDGTGRGTPIVAGTLGQWSQSGRSYGSSPITDNLVSAPLTGGGTQGTNAPGRRKEDDENLVVFAQNQRDEVREIKSAGALAAEPGMKQQTFIGDRSSVRRLTPRECERLQGFPDDYTLIPYRGKPASDTARYRALGNSMAVPVMRWIGGRIRTVYTGGTER